VVVGLKGGEDQDLYLRYLSPDLAAGFEAVHVWHLEIHQDNVRLEFYGLLHGLDSVRRLPDHINPWVFVQETCQPRPEKRLVVGDEDASDLRSRAQHRISFGTIALTIVP